MERTFHAATSGEEVILVNTSPILFSTIGVRVDQIRLMVLPQEIQYEIDYSLTDAELFHSLFDERSDGEHTIAVHPQFRFVKATEDNEASVILPRGVTANFSMHSIDEAKGLFRCSGSLGRSNFADTYTLGAYRAVHVETPVPMETVTFQVDVQNPGSSISEDV